MRLSAQLKAVAILFLAWLWLHMAVASADDSPYGTHALPIAQTGVQPLAPPPIAQDPLLSTAAAELRAMLNPYIVLLPDETVFFHWTNAISRPEQLPRYLHDVPLNFGSGMKTDDWEGPGLYVAQDPDSSWGAYGHQLVMMKLRQGTALVYVNAVGAFPIELKKDSDIRKWLEKSAKWAGKKADLSKKLSPHDLSDLAGGGDLMRQAGVGGMLYDWNQVHPPEGCNATNPAAVAIIEPGVIAEAKIISDDTLFYISYPEFRKFGDRDFLFLKILNVDMGTPREQDWHQRVPDAEFQEYVQWKNRHLFMCQRPYLEERFKTAN